METKALKEYGLSEKEIAVYLTGLKFGLASVSDYANNTDLPRTTTYDVLKSLKEKGVASYVIRSGAKYFSVTDPQELLNKLKDKEEELESIIPSLKALQKMSIHKPKVEFYQGFEGFKTAANDLLKQDMKTNYLACVAEKNLKYLSCFHIQFRRKRKERGIFVRMLAQKSELSIQMKRKDKKELRETRFLDRVMGDSDTSFFIYGNKIAYIMATEEEQLGIIIDSKAIADFQTKVFEELWSVAKKTNFVNKNKLTRLNPQ